MDASPIQTVAQVASESPTYYTWFMGALGAVTRVCLVRGRGTQLNLYQVVATLISGTVFAGAGGSVGSMVGMGGVSIGLSAYFAGIFGMVVAEAVCNRTMGDTK